VKDMFVELSNNYFNSFTEERKKQDEKATEVANSKKFANPDELIAAYEDVEQLLTKRSSSEITEEDKKKYNITRIK
jgi:hypothetical protein